MPEDSGRDPWDAAPGTELPGEVPVIEMTGDPDETTAGPDERMALLSVAAHFTTCREDAAAVAINAAALLAWAESASSPGDLCLRMEAVERHRTDRSAARNHGADLVMDDPDSFLAGARTLYAFATGGAR
jgi:hypothetical protein